jgi:hypothetical protein
MDWALAFLVGMGTSLIELLSRYRDEPIKVIATSQFAWVYLLLNGLMAIGAHAVLLDSGFTTIETPTSRATLAVGSGVSAALILRSRVFTARLGDEQVSIGPGYIVDQLLGIIDAQIDRRRALQRVSIVVGVMDGKEFDGSRIHAATMITGSRQNLSLQAQQDLANQIREVVDRKIPDQEKSYALGFILLDFMGEEFLKAVSAKLPSVEKEPVEVPTFVAPGITDTGAGIVAKRTWGASLPVQRAKVVRELLTGADHLAARQRPARHQRGRAHAAAPADRRRARPPGQRRGQGVRDRVRGARPVGLGSVPRVLLRPAPQGARQPEPGRRDAERGCVCQG